MHILLAKALVTVSHDNIIHVLVSLALIQHTVKCKMVKYSLIYNPCFEELQHLIS